MNKKMINFFLYQAKEGLKEMFVLTIKSAVFIAFWAGLLYLLIAISKSLGAGFIGGFLPWVVLVAVAVKCLCAYFDWKLETGYGKVWNEKDKRFE